MVQATGSAAKSSVTDLVAPDAVVGVLPMVRLTPRDVSIAGLDDARIDLGGTWRFVRDVPPSFDGSARSIEGWRDVTMPGHFGLQGLGRMHADEGVPVAYTRQMDIPADWRNRRIVLRFEAVDGLTRLWINGQPAGSNDIACLPSEYDITDLARIGEPNEITLTVEKSLVTRWSRRELGGITRPVWLQALPAVNLARLHVDTTIPTLHDPRGRVQAHLKIANQSDEPAGNMSVMLMLIGPDGAEMRLYPEPVRLPDIASGQTLEVTIPAHVASPHLWTAETPLLYHLRAELLSDGNSLMSATQRFGFRDVRVDGHRLLVNNVPVKLRGTNYHITSPGLGESVPRDHIERDIRLFRAANINALRSRPTPSIDYVELCDEIGMYTTVEAMISLMMYDAGPKKDHGSDPAIAPGYRHHVATMIESMYSNPSILTWGLGNECPYYDYFKTAALGMRRADTTRPLFFGSDARLGVGIPFMDINDDHYQRDGVTTVADPGAVVGKGWDYPKDRPNIFTEWMHVHTNNTKEIAYDPGIDDFWGYVAEAHIEFMMRTPEYAGGFHFKGAPYRGIGINFPWRGMFDDDRRINDTYWHTLKAHSPVRVHDQAARWDDASKTVSLDVENRLDFTDLTSIRFSWTRGNASGRATVEVPPHGRGTIDLPTDPSSAEPIVLDVSLADGTLIDRYAIAKPAAQPVVVTGGVVELTERNDAIIVSASDVTWTIDRATGLIRSGDLEGRRIVEGSPTLVVLPAQFLKFRPQQKLTLVNQAFDWKASDVQVTRSESGVRVQASGQYALAEGSIISTFAGDGSVSVAYDFVWKGDEATQRFNCFAWGFAMPVVESFDTLDWSRRAQWSWYPEHHIGRAVGSTSAAGPNRPADAPYVWSLEKVDGVTRDFRATRFFVEQAALRDSNGVGLGVRSDATQHVQATPRHGDLEGEIFTAERHGPRQPGYFLNVYRFHNGGTEPHLTKSLTFETLVVEPGARFADTAVFAPVRPN
jgi:hypothetical protein